MAYEGSSYNGYNQKERNDNFKELKRRLASGELSPAIGPCALCGDPEPKTKIPFEYHNEDYGMNPFLDKNLLCLLCVEIAIETNYTSGSGTINCGKHFSRMCVGAAMPAI
jgi:hypothetical protein